MTRTNNLGVPDFSMSGTFMRLPAKHDEAKLAIYGIPFDTATSFRPGARFGPTAIRQASLPLSPDNQALKVAPFVDTNAIDIGDLPTITYDIHRTYDVISDTVRKLMEKGIIPIGLGGDHAVTLGNLRAAAAVHGPVALLQFDSHVDTWDNEMGEKYWHGSPFIRAAEEGLLQADKVFQIGMRGSDHGTSEELGFNVINQIELFERGIDDVIKQVKETIGDTPCFLTFDIDFVDPAYAPGTGTPEVGGFSSHETLQFIRALTDMNFIGFDLVEVLPALDTSEITAMLAATIVHQFGSLAALQLQNK